MSARDELTEIIQDCGEYIPGSHADDYVSPDKAADAILTAGYRKPRQVATVEELDVLPVGSVVLCRGRSWQRYEPRKTDSLGFYSAYTWQCPDGGFVREPKDGFTILPATVIHEP